jgi:hypothetical protein
MTKPSANALRPKLDVALRGPLGAPGFHQCPPRLNAFAKPASFGMCWRYAAIGS